LADKLCTFETLTLICKTNAEKSAAELYENYKQRNEIEIMFDGYKHFLEADKTHMPNRYVLDGWLLAMITYYKLFERLKTAKLLKKISPKDVIYPSEMIHWIFPRNCV
jgi:hypothetical protein